jgi:predicted small lipoprotein YifL
MKKTFSLLLIIIALITALVACGQTNNQTGPDDAVWDAGRWDQARYR